MLISQPRSSSSFADSLVGPPLPAAAIPLTFEDRWAAWEAKGEAHDALVLRRMRLAAPMLAAFTAAALYLLSR
ncbi:MAG: hypothetical protein AB7H96_02240 [Vicinamibacterales bacterium]